MGITGQTPLGYEEQAVLALPGVTDEHRGELAFQLLLSVSTSTLASVLNRLLPLLHRDFLGLLPLEISLSVLAMTDVKTVGRCMRVSKKWKVVAQDNGLWRTLYKRMGWKVAKNFMKALGQNHLGVEAGSDSSNRDFSIDKTSSTASAGTVVSEVARATSEERMARSLPTSLLHGTACGSKDIGMHTASGLAPRTLVKQSASVPFVTASGQSSSASQPLSRGSSSGSLLPTPLAVVHSPFPDADTSFLAPALARSMSTSSISSTASSRRSSFDFPHSASALPFSASSSTQHSVSSSGHPSPSLAPVSGHLRISTSRSSTPHASPAGSPASSPKTRLPAFAPTPAEPHLLSAPRSPTFSPPMPYLDLPPCDSVLPQPPVVPLELVRLDPDWRHIYRQRVILERNWRNKKYIRTEMQGHEEGVYCLQFDEDKVVSGSRDGETRIGGVLTESPFNPHRHLYYLLLDTIRIWSLRTHQPIRTLRGHSASVLCLHFQGSTLVSGGSDARILVWDLQTGAVVRRLEGHAESVLNLRYESGEGIVVSCSKDRTVRVWGVKRGECRKVLRGHRAAVNAVQIANGVIVSASGDRSIKLWSLATGECIRTLFGHTRGIACVQFDGELIVSGSSDETIRVWDARTGASLMVFTGHTELVRTLQFDSQKVVSGSYDETLKVWDIKTGEMLMDLKNGHTSRVFKLQFSDTKIVSCSQDMKILVWDFTEGVDAKYFD
ncbi:hypothetical protein HDU93_000215 [Gonapodya sp. JEL0774]|nr:hypothetical protein HDU93_000215 [Gonapodya sp. JEL0774]